MQLVVSMLKYSALSTLVNGIFLLKLFAAHFKVIYMVYVELSFCTTLNTEENSACTCKLYANLTI